MRRRSDANPATATYFEELSRTPLLTADEEVDLAARIAAGDEGARDHLVRANLRLVVRIARGYARRGGSLPDLIAEGNLGLMRAADSFDPTSHDTRFSTYASYWVKQAVKRHMQYDRVVHIPAYLQGKAGAGHKHAAFAEAAKTVYGFGDHDEPGTVAEPAAAADDSREIAERAEVVRRALARLDDRSREVVLRRLDGETLKSIGAGMGRTRERVRQIEADAHARLRELLADVA